MRGLRLTRGAARPIKARRARAGADRLTMVAVRLDIQAATAAMAVLGRHLARLVRVAALGRTPPGRIWIAQFSVEFVRRTESEVATSQCSRK